MTRLSRGRIIACLFGLACTTPQAAWAQAGAASIRRDFDAGMRTALGGRADSALLYFTRAADAARAGGERSLRNAAMRGQANVWLTLRGCPDSALKILRDAVANAEPGDRAAADALVRLLSSRGDAAGARATLVSAYTGSSTRAVTSETVNFLMGNAAIELAEGHESAALSTINEAIGIADRLHLGDPSGFQAHAVGDVTRENAWLIFDLAQLRAQAKSPGIRSPRESARLMAMLLAAWGSVDDVATSPRPIVRLGDRLILRAERCRMDGTSCPVPASSPGC